MSPSTPHASPPFVINCPHCHRRLKVDPAKLGVSRKCPACFAVLKLDLIEDVKSHPEPEVRHVETITTSATIPAASPFIEAAPSVPARRPPAVPQLDVERPRVPTLAEAPLFDVDDIEDYGDPPVRERARRSSSMSFPARRLLLMFLLHWCPPLMLILLGFAAGDGGTILDCVLIALIYFFFLGVPISWLVHLILVLFVRTFTCPGCGFEMDAVGRWGIGQYHDHRERHVLNARNPIDGSRVGHVNCPKCDATIIIQWGERE